METSLIGIPSLHTGILDKQLLEAQYVLAQVISGDLPMNENFDIIELSLRR